MTTVPVSSVVEAHLARALAETLRGLGIELKPQSGILDEIDLQGSDLLSAVMGLSFGDDRGTFVLAVDRRGLLLTLQDACPQVTVKNVNDWWGEAANLTLGHFKQSLLQHHLSFKITPPSVGEDNGPLLARVGTYAVSSSLTMVDQKTNAYVCLLCTDAAVLTTLTSNDQDTSTPKPGDVILI